MEARDAVGKSPLAQDKVRQTRMLMSGSDSKKSKNVASSGKALSGLEY